MSRSYLYRRIEPLKSVNRIIHKSIKSYLVASERSHTQHWRKIQFSACRRKVSPQTADKTHAHTQYRFNNKLFDVTRCAQLRLIWIRAPFAPNHFPNIRYDARVQFLSFRSTVQLASYKIWRTKFQFFAFLFVFFFSFIIFVTFPFRFLIWHLLTSIVSIDPPLGRVEEDICFIGNRNWVIWVICFIYWFVFVYFIIIFHFSRWAHAAQKMTQ